MDIDRVRGYFNDAATVDHYMKAVANVGLWESEKLLFERHLEKSGKILDLGCGAGRVALGLWELDYENVTGADFAEQMAKEAADIADYLGCPFGFEQQDATRLRYADESFDGVVFAFNGLMQIPGRSNRLKAMSEVCRVLKPGSRFLFTSHDRREPEYAKLFEDATDFEHDLSQNPCLLDYGDRHFHTEHGTTFIHIPICEDIIVDLESVGFGVIEYPMRRDVAQESEEVEDFSEDCRMWVAKKR